MEWNRPVMGATARRPAEGLVTLEFVERQHWYSRYIIGMITIVRLLGLKVQVTVEIVAWVKSRSSKALGVALIAWTAIYHSETCIGQAYPATGISNTSNSSRS